MVHRVLVWLGAGMLTASVAAGMVAGAGVASADSPPGSDTKGTTSSESANSTENKPDSDNDSTGTPKPKPSGKKPKKDATAGPKDADDSDAAKQDEGTLANESPAQQPGEDPTAETVNDAEKTDSDTAETAADKPATPPAVKRQPTAKPTAKPESEDPTPTGSARPSRNQRRYRSGVFDHRTVADPSSRPKGNRKRPARINR